MDTLFPMVASMDTVQNFAQEVHDSFDPIVVGQTALRILSESFQPLLLALYRADPGRRALRLLCALPEAPHSTILPLPGFIAYDAPSLLAHAHQGQTPFLITDLQDPILAREVLLEESFKHKQTRGCLYLPLWCGTSFEGGLLLTFATPLAPTDCVAQTLVNCSLHLAAALSNARLRLTADDERMRQRAILDQLPEGILITEAASGSISYANRVAAQILDIPLGQLLHSPLHTYTQEINERSDDAWPRFPWTFVVIRALGGETVSQIEAVAMRSCGSRVPVLCSSSPLYTTQGIITGAILVFQDITVQKSLEAQRNLFFSFASHELRTPLTVVLGYAAIMQQMAENNVDQLDLPALRLASRRILVQAEQMTYLLNEMLDLSHMDRSQLIMHTTPVNLMHIVKHVVETLAATTDRHELRLVLQGCQSSDQVIILADPMHLTQALNNLVNNAIKYSPQGGEIEIGLSVQTKAPSQVLFWVKDHGLGISQGDLPHLFTRFYRAQNMDSSISGLGIGLYLVKEIIERHNGQIQVESGEGQGSTFTIALPLSSFLSA